MVSRFNILVRLVIYFFSLSNKPEPENITRKNVFDPELS